MDAGFISVVEIGQYFMTKDNGLVVNTLFREKEHHNQKDGFQGTQKLDPYLKSKPAMCMANTELQLEFCL